MIKPEDLRIGDLVRVCCDCEFPKGTVCTVFEIGTIMFHEEKDGVASLIPINCNDDEWQEVWCKDIEGVHLTPEILKKNGWYLDCDLTFSYAHKGHPLEAQFPPNSEWKYVIVGFEVLYKFKYVHELQHILWALGYNAQMSYPEDFNKQKQSKQ